METSKLIEELYFCSTTCDACYLGCLEEEDNDNLRRCMMLDKECLEICRLTGSLLEVDSENTDKFVRLCADICNACAEECQKHHHAHCQKCASECHRCADMCMAYQQHVAT